MHRTALAAAALAACLTAQIQTSRPSPRTLVLPKSEDAFAFAVFGDRTGGPAEGIEVLRQAVKDTNLLDPDLVMTVGDLIEGYNQAEPWLRQMREFTSSMAKLTMPWFPVAGNHDIYWRGANKPPEEHEGRYEKHFGPLWYAFEHKRCWFVVLYSDEPDPKTGERNFGKAECQRMSPEQFAWLGKTLAKAKGARHVFVFLHHPRWIGGRYGDDWQRVHRLLAAAGNVRAVFGGHIHRMRHDGVRDGIEYVTLATTGGVLSRQIPGAGYLHHFHIVTVRPRGIQMATLPVGAVIDPRRITGEVSQHVGTVAGRLRLAQSEPLRIAGDGVVRGVVSFTFKNPIDRPVELTITPTCADARWRFSPDHVHPTVQPSGELRVDIRVERDMASFDSNFAAPELRVGCDYIGTGLRVTLPEVVQPVLLVPPPIDVAVLDAAADRVLEIDGASCLRVHNADLALADGPLTVEGWLRADDLTGRRGFVTKAESSEFGLFVSDGVPTFSIHLDGKYVNARTAKAVLDTDRWHHVAGVFDGAEVRLYVDGRLVAKAAGSGKRTTNDLPLYVGADVDRRGAPTSHFSGRIDEIRIAPTAVYTGTSFAPARRLPRIPSAAVHYRLDQKLGPWSPDASGRAKHAVFVGSPRTVVRRGRRP